jgi:SAM-dependent methyltransferase
MNLLKCRICGHGEAKSLGHIPDCGEFAGQQISPSIKGGELWICKDCDSMFRHPTLSASDYISLYEKAPGTVWMAGELERNDLATIYTYLKNHAGGSILDVGCYTGNFLADLPDKFEKYGIEPSVLASKSAASKGIHVLGKTLDELELNKVFDVVVLIDVIEHVLDVEKLLNQALVHVKKNGLLIISTGNPGCVFWRKVFKSMFWYNLFAEHVTFPGYNFYIEFSKRHGLQPPEQICFRYTKIKTVVRLSRLFHFLLLMAIYKITKIIRKTETGRVFSISHVNHIGVFNDHHAIIFRTKGIG